MSFRALASGVAPLEVIVRFLAVLELYKQGLVDVLQFTNFGELLVRRLADGESALDAASLADWDDAPAVDDDSDDDAIDASLGVLAEDSLARATRPGPPNPPKPSAPAHRRCRRARRGRPRRSPAPSRRSCWRRRNRSRRGCSPNSSSSPVTGSRRCARSWCASTTRLVVAT